MAEKNIFDPLAIYQFIPYHIGMNTNDDPMFTMFVSQALEELAKQNPDVSQEDLYEEAMELAYERWDSYCESQYFQGE